jgi:hypothetical protein
MSETTPIKTIRFACPKCKRPLQSTENALQCDACNRTYPIADGIPDFLSGNSEDDLAPILRIAKGMDILAPIYENRLWYQALLNLAGAGFEKFQPKQEGVFLTFSVHKAALRA